MKPTQYIIALILTLFICTSLIQARNTEKQLQILHNKIVALNVTQEGGWWKEWYYDTTR
jgi:hypothetical protein